MNQQSNSQARPFPFMAAFLSTPKWGTFFYYAKSREELITLFEALLDLGFAVIEQPHELFSDAFLAKMMDNKGREILLKSR